MNYSQTQSQNAQFENQGQQNSNSQPQASFEVVTPDPKYMPYTQQSPIRCHKCGYLSHLAPNCTLKGPAPRRGTQKALQSDTKKLITQHKKPLHNLLNTVQTTM